MPTELMRLIGWFRERVTIKEHEADYLKFVMQEYGKKQYEAGILEGQEIAEHGTTNWQE